MFPPWMAKIYQTCRTRFPQFQGSKNVKWLCLRIVHLKIHSNCHLMSFGVYPDVQTGPNVKSISNFQALSDMDRNGTCSTSPCPTSWSKTRSAWAFSSWGPLGHWGSVDSWHPPVSSNMAIHGHGKSRNIPPISGGFNRHGRRGISNSAGDAKFLQIPWVVANDQKNSVRWRLS